MYEDMFCCQFCGNYYENKNKREHLREHVEGDMVKGPGLIRSDDGTVRIMKCKLFDTGTPNPGYNFYSISVEDWLDEEMKDV